MKILDFFRFRGGAPSLTMGTLSLLWAAPANVNVTWTNASNGTTPYNYNVYRSPNPDMSGPDKIGTGIVSGRFDDLYPFLYAGTTWYYQVIVTDHVGNIAYSNILEVAIPANPPPPSSPGGAREWGTSATTGIAAGTWYVVMGPMQTPGRESMKPVVEVAATGTFNLDYQFTTDGGLSWQTEIQVKSSTVAVDGGASGYTQKARIEVQVGFQWRFVIYITNATEINAVWDWRLVQRRN